MVNDLDPFLSIFWQGLSLMKNVRAIVLILLVCAPCCFHAFAIDPNYQTTLQTLCDALLATQITDQTNQNYGALVCPSTNPDVHKIHSRAAEAVYPFAVLYKLTGQAKYLNAAIILGNWLVSIQETTGAQNGGWSESWPDPTQSGWYGTTADQLMSLAGAYTLITSSLTATQLTNWQNCMVKAADWSVGFFPTSNVNYNAISATALLFCYNNLPGPKATWLTKSNDLITHGTLDSIITDNFVFGEGKGVDLGYNMAQSIGYIALYSILSNDATVKQKAVDLLHTHYMFVYPNGSVDNSWGTRSYKWGYESGTKTAPGVYFSFALLADADPKFNGAGLACLEYLRTKCIDSGWITYGPHAKSHATCTPPCNYQTFARAQSLALAIEYGPTVTATDLFPAQTLNWYKYFPEVNVTLVRTQKIMATVSAYGDIAAYSRSTVPKGGSICNLWYEGFGDNGYLQSSSATVYTRTETMHMPIEDTVPPLLPLTPRVEAAISGTYYTNLYETGATMTAVQAADNVTVTTTGHLVSASGAASAVNFTIANKFYNTSVRKIITVSGAAASFKIIEPIVNDPHTAFSKPTSSSVSITPLSGSTWTMQVDSNTVPYTITTGTDSAQYWCPFPAVQGYPLIISFSTTSTAAQTIALTLSGPPAVAVTAPRSPVFSSRSTNGLWYWKSCGRSVGIGYSVREQGRTILQIYSVTGQLVASVVDKTELRGDHSIVWNGTGATGRAVPRGMYLCVLVKCGYKAAIPLALQ
jgi:hypothetical protein